MGAVVLNPDEREGGVGGGSRSIFCSSPCPDYEFVWCRRLKNHDGECSAFAVSIEVPYEWEKPLDHDQ